MVHRRRRRVLLALAAVELLAGSTLLGHRWITTSTEVSVDRALERFRQQGDLVRASTPAPTAEVATPAPTPTPRGRAGSRAVTPSPAPTPTPFDPSRPSPLPPEAGVYRWRTEGWEEASGVRRDLPDRSVRVITDEGGGTWLNEHQYSQEHTEWFTLTVNEQGVFSESYRAAVTFGPFTTDQTMHFQPPTRFTVFPLEVGQRWQGEWDGDTSGSYVGTTFERTTVRVGDEDVDTWGIQIDMTMEGEIAGRVSMKIWVSPVHRMTVKEHLDQDVRSGPGSYKGVWTITLLSTRPET
jgi:hypothetical protein